MLCGPPAKVFVYSANVTYIEEDCFVNVEVVIFLCYGFPIRLHYSYKHIYSNRNYVHGNDFIWGRKREEYVKINGQVLFEQDNFNREFLEKFRADILHANLSVLDGYGDVEKFFKTIVYEWFSSVMFRSNLDDFAPDETYYYCSFVEDESEEDEEPKKKKQKKESEDDGE